MPGVDTNAIRAFQNKVYANPNGEVRLNKNEARALSRELSQLTAMLLEYQTAIESGTFTVEVGGGKF